MPADTAAAKKMTVDLKVYIIVIVIFI